MYRIGTTVLMIAVVGLIVGLTSSIPGNHGVVDGERTFIGATKCKTCHKKPEDGEQFRIWEESAHAKAFEVLASEEAMAIAAEKGIENPQAADECLTCHVTGHGAAPEMLGPKYDIAEGVGCESCHGAGGDYYKKKTMAAIAAGEIEPASVGLEEPNEEKCLTCHNEESPTYKSFNFEEMVAKIAHPIPEAAPEE